jgi:hypothetical protein
MILDWHCTNCNSIANRRVTLTAGISLEQARETLKSVAMKSQEERVQGGFPSLGRFVGARGNLLADTGNQIGSKTQIIGRVRGEGRFLRVATTDGM